MIDIERRAAVLFSQAREAIDTECRAMHAEHSAKGLLGSGATAKRAVAIFASQLSKALNQAMAEVAMQVEHRGKAWTVAMAVLSKGLETQIAGAQEVLAPSFRLARLPGPSAQKAVQDLIDKCGDDLREELRAFEEGWTAPKAKGWSERHPVAYAILLLLLGSLVGAIITRLLPSS
jgi:hypothetical protein